MRHRRGYRKLNKATDQRLAMLRAQVSSLFEHGKIKIIEARAKEARKMADKIISLTKKNSVSSRRQAFSALRNKVLVKKIFAEFPTRFEGRPGGYTRIIKAGRRKGDSAPLAILELL